MISPFLGKSVKQGLINRSQIMNKYLVIVGKYLRESLFNFRIHIAGWSGTIGEVIQCQVEV